MRVWLKPDRMRAYKISTEDVMKALAEQSVIGSPGRLGQATGKTSQSIEYVLTYHGRFNKPEQYGNIILRANPEGEILRLKDVGRSRTWAPNSSTFTRTSTAIPLLPSFSSKPPAPTPPTVIAKIKEKLEEIKKESFPPGMDYRVRLRRFQVSWTPPSKRCCTPCSRPSFWCLWWSTCSSEICVPR